jgi:type I restriction enzyme, S subunit
MMLDLPSDWRYIRVKDLCQALNGRAFKSTEWASSGFPIIRIQNLKNPNATYNYYQGNFDQKHLVKKGDLLFAWSGTPGTSFGAHIWEHGDALLNQHIFKLVVDNALVDKKYFRLALNENVAKYIEQAQGGVGLAHITKTKFDNSLIVLPPLNQQKCIVAKIEELFSEIDNALENLLKAQKLLKAYRQSLLKNAFEGKLTEKWREKNKNKLKTTDEFRTYLRHKRKEHHQKSIEQWESNDTTGRTASSPRPRSLKNLNMLSATELENLPTLPDAWVWDKLGCMTLGVEYGTSAKSSKQGDVVVLRMGNIQNCTFIWKDLAFTSNKQEIAKYSLKKDDVLFNRTNSPELVGKTALYKGEYPAIFAGYLIRINQIHSVVTSKYLNFYLNSPVAKQHGNRVKTDGVNQSNINGDKLINYPFPFCSIEEQKVIVIVLEEYLSATDNLEGEIQKDLHRLNALRQSVLKKAFSGEFIPQNATDESASILLGLIKAEKEPQNPSKKKSKQLQKAAV